jgi:D-cysteine desulfhydrase
MRSRVVAVKVVPGFVNELPQLRRLARRMKRLVPALPEESLSLENLVIDSTELGAGYGRPTVEARAAAEFFARTEDMKLDDTYTGKAAAVFRRAVATGSGGPFLFWLTYSEYRG